MMGGGMGPMVPLPISEFQKETYARARLGIRAPSADYERFCTLIEAQDATYLQWYAKQAKSRANASGEGEYETHDDVGGASSDDEAADE